MKKEIKLKLEEMEKFATIFLKDKKQVKGLPNVFVTITGKIFHGFREQKLNIITNSSGKNYYTLYIPGYGTFMAQRLIANAFIDNNLSLKADGNDVDHIDGNGLNNNVSNLQILTHSENLLKAVYEEGKTTGKEIKACIAENIKTGEIREYPSTKELVRDIWGKENAGYFNRAYTTNALVKKEWKIYYKEEK